MSALARRKGSVPNQEQNRYYITVVGEEKGKRRRKEVIIPYSKLPEGRGRMTQVLTFFFTMRQKKRRTITSNLVLLSGERKRKAGMVLPLCIGDCQRRERRKERGDVIWYLINRGKRKGKNFPTLPVSGALKGGEGGGMMDNANTGSTVVGV